MDFGQLILNSLIQAFSRPQTQQGAAAAPAASAAPAAAPAAAPIASAATVQGRTPVADTTWRAQQAGVTPEEMERRKAEGAAHEAAKRAAMQEAIARTAGGIGASYAPTPPEYTPTVPQLLPKKSTKRGGESAPVKTATAPTPVASAAPAPSPVAPAQAAATAAKPSPTEMLAQLLGAMDQAPQSGGQPASRYSSAEQARLARDPAYAKAAGVPVNGSKKK